jgi:hypothetical protein
MFAILAATLLAVLIMDRLEQRAKRRDREIVRRIHTYLASLPPARPW